MATQTRRLTYEEYLKGPEIKQRYDIVDGEMIMALAPTVEHQRILRQLFRMLDRFVTQHGLGEVLFAPVDVLIQREPLRTRQPDLLFVSKERSEILGQIVEGAPDLVIEVLSPGNTRGDVEGKLADYARLGVRECWLVSPEARTIETLALAEGAWQRIGIFGVGDKVASKTLDAIELEVSQVFHEARL